MDVGNAVTDRQHAANSRLARRRSSRSGANDAEISAARYPCSAFHRHSERIEFGSDRGVDLAAEPDDEASEKLWIDLGIDRDIV
jgi:hypothetical protein